MAEPSFEAVLRRDRMIVAGALILLIVLAWGYVLRLVDAMRMGGMEMPGMRIVANPLGAAMIPALQPWSATEFVLMFVMWTIMMFGMMVPSAAPMILIYARVGREAEKKGKPLAGTAYFVAGYLLAWTAASALVLPTTAGAQTYGPEGKELAPGVRQVDLGEGDSVLPAYKMLKLRDIVIQPGAKTPDNVMKNDMLCHMTEGELAVVQNGKEFTVKKGGVWACAKGITTEGTQNKGSEVLGLRHVGGYRHPSSDAPARAARASATEAYGPWGV
jgi:quercetin dioxygenase-like cupin family protein